MILLYHKVALEARSEWWVSADAFDRQLAALAAFDVVTLADYDSSNPRHVVITFDGVYENVFQYAFPLLKKWGYPFELFVTGDYIGGDNAFDSIEPLTRFCTIEQLQAMVAGGGRVQWHTASHRKLAGLGEADLAAEIVPPASLRQLFPAPHLAWFAYPHGDHSQQAVDHVQRHFEGALSCVAGNDSDRYQLNRLTVLEDTRLDRTRVTVIVANYNYGAYLPQAMDSVLRQSVPADEIILIDDGSTDGSQDIARRYEGRARVVLNESNLGIVGNFNKAVGLATGDYIAFLGADNLMRSDYVERCKVALDRNADAAIAYTDMVIFGARAAELAAKVGAEEIGASAAERWPLFQWRFPDPTPEAVANVQTRNFMHGSSMYRRAAFDQVGGYRSIGEAEDHDLFRRMLGQGWKAVRVAEPVILYRQHSANQANTVLGLQLEISRLTQLEKQLAGEVQALDTQHASLAREHDGLVGRHAELVQQHGAIVDQHADLVAQYGELVRQREEELAAANAKVQEYLAAALHAQGQASQAHATAVAWRSLAEQMRASRSWRITLPMRLGARLARHGLVDDDRRKVVGSLKTLYRRAPLPQPVKTQLKRAYQWVQRRQWENRLTAPVDVAPVHSKSSNGIGHRAALRIEACPDYIVWGVIDWHFRHQRPQHLAQSIAATGRRVFYISVNLNDDPRGGFEIEQLDTAARLFQVRLNLRGAPSIYTQPPAAADVAQLRQSIGELLEWADAGPVVSLVQHPYWHGVASVLPHGRMVYDCMDHHEGFGNNAEGILALEQALLRDADLTIATSDWLQDIIAPRAQRCALIRNAGQYSHFAVPPPDVFRDAQGRKVIGYMGAIAEWFDIALVEKMARRFPDCLLLLVGNDTVGAGERLRGCANVQFTGEVPYGKLPYYVHGFDVCLLPFQIIPLTLATNPVKVYEYLGAGKPVVAVDLPEIRQFGELVEKGATHEEFLAGVERALRDPSPDAAERRQAFAREQTWVQRARALVEVAEAPLPAPPASVIVVTYNNLELTKTCLASLDRYSDHPAMEIIVVDNASSDGSPEYLREWERGAANRRVILNPDNRGFAAANNQGLAVAKGDYLVLLNNDTHVTPGWLGALIGHLRRDPAIGLLGPVTNNIGNEAKLEIDYPDMAAMLQRAAGFTRRHIGVAFPMKTAAFFCVAMPRSVYEKIGSLDEAFGRGFFEDDDYCRRVEQAGLKVMCAEDVFIHHHLSASFNKLRSADRQALFEQNRATYEKKWGKWEWHAYSRDRGPMPPPTPRTLPPVPEAFAGQDFIVGHCAVCGRNARFFSPERLLWRETLNCEHCLATSRYRSIARGLLRGIRDITGIEADSLATLPKSGVARKLTAYDTQPPFYYAGCAYPLPDLLAATGWIEVARSQFKPDRPWGEEISPGVTNQNLEQLTYGDGSIDLLVTSDVMEHVRLDDQAHRDIHRVLSTGGAYVFTVPHDMALPDTMVRVRVTDPADPSRDEMLMEPEYHGDTNGDGSGVLSYRVYGRTLPKMLEDLGFEVSYSRDDVPEEGVMQTELFYCRKVRGVKRWMAIAAIGLVLLGTVAAAWYGFRRIGWPQGLPTQDQELQDYLTYLAGATALAGLTASLLKWNPWAALLACVAALALFSGSGPALLAALLVLLASLVLGRGVLWLLRVRDEAAGWTASLLVGAGIYGTLIGLVARYPVHYAWTYAPALLLPILLGRRWIAGVAAGWWQARRQLQLPHWGTAAVDGLIGGIALVHVGIALLPELGQDALAVHLYVGNQLAARHAWSFDAGKYVWAVMPMLADWIFAAGIMLGGETAGRLLNVAFIGVVGVLVRELVRWCGGNSAAQRWALLVFLSMPLTFSLAVSLFIESVWTAFVLAGVLALLRFVSDEGKPREVVPAGVFIGFALAAKAVTLTLMPILLAVLLARPRKWLARGGVASVVAATGLGVLLGCFPYVNAWIRTGNPVFPFFNRLFRSPLYPAENFESASMFSRWLRWDFPYQSAFNSIQFIEGQPGSGGFQWLLVVVPAAVLLVLAWRRRALALLLIALGSIVIAFASVAYLRYVFPAFALACAAAGVALADDRFGRAPRIMLGVVAAGAVVLNLLFLGAGSPYRDFAFHALRDKATREAWLELRLPLRRAISLVNELNTGGAPVAVLGAPVLGHLAADALIPSWYNLRFYHLMGVPRTGPDMVRTLQDEGIEYILFDPTWPQPPRPKAIVDSVTEPVASYGVSSLRRFKSEFRFRHELLANPRFQDASGWQFAGAPPRPAGGLVVAGTGSAAQTVPVQPMRRYVNEITVRCDAPSGARTQVNWSSAAGLFLKTDIQVFECTPEVATHRMEVVAPREAAIATVYAVGHAGGRVEFQQNSLRR